jgi:ParB family transcriptional regulator, chromosome partitioning protein
MSQTAPRAVLEYLDPATVVLDDNVRTEVPLDPDFIASIKEVGVLEPPVAHRLGPSFR